jgi:hypothetical protein
MNIVGICCGLHSSGWEHTTTTGSYKQKWISKKKNIIFYSKHTTKSRILQIKKLIFKKLFSIKIIIPKPSIIIIIIIIIIIK